MKKLIFCLFALSFFGGSGLLHAQTDGQSIYNSAVDQINCQTIKFIHTEAGRPKVAANLQCFTFESILQSIPADEAGTTAKLAKDIEAYKSKYIAAKPLDKQLQAVIDFAAARVKAKPRTGDINAFVKSLSDIKKEAVENLASIQTQAVEAPAEDNRDLEGPETPVATGGVVIDDNDDAPETDAEAGTSESNKANEGPFGWLVLILSLIAIGLSIYTLLLIKRIPAGGVKAGAGKTNLVKPEPENSEAITELMVRLRQTETRLSDEMKRLYEEVNAKLGSLTVTAAYTPPIKFSSPNEEEQNEPSDMPPVEYDMEESDADEAIEMQEEEESLTYIEENEMDADTPEDSDEWEDKQHSEEDPEEMEAAPLMEDDLDEGDMVFEYESEENPDTEEKEPEKSVPSDESVQEPDAVEQSVEPGNYGEEDLNPAPVAPEGGVEGEEEAETEPHYVYAGLPQADGSFQENELQEFAEADSVYEIEMYEDVPNRAFISLLPYPDLIKKMIADPQTYLAPCCEFEGDPDGKHTIVLLEEGIMTRQGETWLIEQKARIRFE